MALKKDDCVAMQEQLCLLAYGELADNARHRLESHLRGCGECAAELEQIQALQLLVRAAPVVDPSPSFLASARMSLDDALDRVPPVGGAGRLRQALRAWAFQLRVVPATAAALLLIGFAGGGVTGVELAKRAAVKPVDGNSASESAGVVAGSANALPEGIANISGVAVQPGSNLVEVHYNRMVPGAMEADASDPRIQQLLLLATQNRANPGVRVDSVGLLADQCRAGRDCDDGGAGETVRQALMASLRYDKNAGVRLKALDGLAPYVGSDEAVRDSVLEALVHDDNPGVRTQAIQLLTPVQADGSVRQVLHTLAADDRNPYIRTVSQETLAQSPAMQ